MKINQSRLIITQIKRSEAIYGIGAPHFMPYSGTFRNGAGKINYRLVSQAEMHFKTANSSPYTDFKNDYE
jgi:hypothetical protein